LAFRGALTIVELIGAAGLLKTVTGRNQTSNAKFILGPARWMRGLIRPPEGHGIAYVDFSSLYPPLRQFLQACTHR
jgi:hypothetical protein